MGQVIMGQDKLLLGVMVGWKDQGQELEHPLFYPTRGLGVVQLILIGSDLEGVLAPLLEMIQSRHHPFSTRGVWAI